MKRDAHLMMKFVLISGNERSPACPERSAGIFLHCDSHLTPHDCRSCPLSFITRNNVTFILAITIMCFSTCHSRPAAAAACVICWIFCRIQPQRRDEESLHTSNLAGNSVLSAILCLLTLNDCWICRDLRLGSFFIAEIQHIEIMTMWWQQGCSVVFVVSILWLFPSQPHTHSYQSSLS